MAGETGLDTSMAIRYLNGNLDVVAKVTALPTVILPLTVVGELLFGAENSARSLTNITRYLQFIDTCIVLPMGRQTAALYSHFATKHKCDILMKSGTRQCQSLYSSKNNA